MRGDEFLTSKGAKCMEIAKDSGLIRFYDNKSNTYFVPLDEVDDYEDSIARLIEFGYEVEVDSEYCEEYGVMVIFEREDE